LRRLRRLALTLLQDLLAVRQFDLGIHLVSAAEITRLNETFLRHQGSTDVITFNYADPPGPGLGRSGHGAAAGFLRPSRCSLGAAPFPSPPLEEGVRERRPSVSARPPDACKVQATAGRSTDERYACSTQLHGEIFICVDEAVAQARRFRTSWQSELIRYLIHGLLHLRGYDDHNASSRRQMKRKEDRVLRRLAGCLKLD
jgi:rRNA maturation RNase YbeY